MADILLPVNTAVVVPVNIYPLVDETDGFTREAVAYNAAGMALEWNFVTRAGAMSQTAVTPTTGGDYDWTDLGGGMMKIEIPASGGASINNDTEGYGWFTGKCTATSPWRGPIIEFSARLPETGAIVSDAGNLATFFVTDLTSAVSNYCVGSFLKFTSGALINQVRRITSYSGTNFSIGVSSAFTGTPAAADMFIIINQ